MLARLSWLLGTLMIVSGSTSTLVSAPATNTPLPELKRVADVRTLSRTEAERGYPVRLRGTVTYVNQHARIATLRDNTGATFFDLPSGDSDAAVTLERGEFIEVTGRTQRGNFAPSVTGANGLPATVQSLNRRPLPRPIHLDPEDLTNPANHAGYVELRGVVRAYEEAPPEFGEGLVNLRISTSGGQFDAILPAPATPAINSPRLRGAVVTVRGIYVSVATRYHKLVGTRVLMQDWSELRIEDPGLHAFAAIPIRNVNSILKFQPGTRLRQRVAGTVTMEDPQRGFYLADRTGWLWIETPQEDPIWPGVMVQVVGFPTDKDGFPALQNAVFAVVGETNQPPPLSIAAAGAFSGLFHGAPVNLQGKVVDHLIQPDTQSMLLESDGHFFQVRLLANKITPLPDLPEIGSLVEATGICVNEFRRNTDADAENEFQAVSFHLHVRKPQDITTLAPPPFWTGRRILWALLLIAAALIVSMAWIHALRRQVDRQTALIEDKHQRETIMEERTRIARELHDTLEQELAGVQMQLDAASGNLTSAPTIAADTLDMARAMLRHSRNETRRSVWDLRSTALESGDLESAFHEVIHMLHGQTTDVAIAITCNGERRRLPVQIENNMLRIGQEAVNNAIEHGRPSHVKIALEYRPASVTLRVSDNGAGFNPGRERSAPDGHFGLAGMRERARKINSRIRVDSDTQHGTVVELTVPFTPQSPANPNEAQTPS